MIFIILEPHTQGGKATTPPAQELPVQFTLHMQEGSAVRVQDPSDYIGIKKIDLTEFSTIVKL